MKGIVEKEEEQEGNTTITVKLNMEEDLNHSWIAKFEKEKLLFFDSNQESDKIRWEDWLEQNININGKDYSVISKSEPNVYIKVEMFVKTKETLKNFADKNLKQFILTDDFDQNLLIKSPRELETDEEKEAIYKKSEKVEVEKLMTNFLDKRIDYFLSHSWAEDTEIKTNKVKTLYSFSRRSNKPPTVWLDKVCINQIEPGLGIAVLPINVYYCKKLLILLTDSYLERLWCIWELFSIFIFDAKELAIDRLEILLVDKDIDTSTSNNQSFFVLENVKKKVKGLETLKHLLRAFNLDNAHCFSPNEEFKLRQILYTIGEEAIDEIKSTLILMVNKQLVRWKHWETFLKFVTITSKTSKVHCDNELYCRVSLGQEKGTV